MLTLSIKHYRVFGMSEKAVVLFSAYYLFTKCIDQKRIIAEEPTLEIIILFLRKSQF